MIRGLLAVLHFAGFYVTREGDALSRCLYCGREIVDFWHDARHR